MKQLICIIVALLGLFISTTSSSSSAEVVQGVVIYDGRSDYHIVETRKWFVIVEWYNGPDFSRDDILTGELHSYGFKMVRVNKEERETKIYIENYHSSKDRCFEWLKEHGKLK